MAETGLAKVESGRHSGQKADAVLHKARAYLMLTKPRIVVLLLITTVPAMVVAQRGWPPLGLVFWTILGGTLAAGGANAVNCYVDRDIDVLMTRTAHRPIPAGEISPTGGLVFGIALGAIAFVQLWVTVNLLAAVLAVSALLFYVFVYTIFLKRSTAQNIVIGGAAGAVPVLVGWAAVTGSLGVAPIVMFFVIFYWTPPHFWALAIKYKDDYALAGVPMLPVTHGIPETTRYILLYSWQMVAVTLILFPAARMGAVYLISASVLGVVFLYKAVVLRRRQTIESAMSLFHFSISYLALLFGAILVDQLLGD